MASESDRAPIVGAAARLIRDGSWAECRLAEITPSRAILLVEESLEIGEKIIACVRDVGALPATVAESLDGAYAVAFERRAPELAAHLPLCYGRA